MKIGIIGSEGVLGSTLSFGFTKLGHDVFGYDIRNPETKIEDVIKTDLVYICVPSPIADDGSCDCEIVESVLEQLNNLAGMRNNFPYIVIKSTIPPGTTNYFQQKFHFLSVAFVPEFLRERCAVCDFVEMHNLLAVGTTNQWFYELIVESHGHYPKNIVKLTPTEAEFLKYYHNAVAALRIIFANEMYDLAEKLDINYLNVKNALIKSTQLPDRYFDVSKNLRGFGGTCLPKDTLALLKLAENYDVDLDLLEAVVVKNQKYQPTVYPGMRS